MIMFCNKTMIRAEQIMWVQIESLKSFSKKYRDIRLNKDSISNHNTGLKIAKTKAV